MATARDDALEARRAEAIALRLKGFTCRAIAKQLGVSHTTAHNYIVKELDLIRSEAAEDARHVLDLELMRLDRAQAVVAEKIAEGDLQAVDRQIRLADQRAKLLGLYATGNDETHGGAREPTRIEIILPDGVKAPDADDSTPSE